ncbi:hypothetical protein HAPAU_39020 [Halalkalicoccus paucihalophilus]|uniref:Uncharacterized protein n=1 Tax=Halalkalicoccus paucihalophilus TaxID=1008153 RepID=A0A151A881_9EURY|nr:hypothetical protein HAPAU_39020 [Halalkalicoccus paucihalophilus]
MESRLKSAALQEWVVNGEPTSDLSPKYSFPSSVSKVVAVRAATGGSEHGAEGGAVGLGPVRLVAKKRVATTGYASHHRLRSGKWTVVQPVRDTETHSLYQFFAAP